MSQPTADRLPQAWLAAAMERLPDGVAVFDGDWTIRYANRAATRLLGAHSAELAGRNLWIALPEVAGSVFHSFLLHARTLGTPVTWRGFYAPAGRWLSATAELADDLLQVCFREVADLPAEGPADPADEQVAAAGEDADHDRLRFLAEVSEALITTLDRGESAGQLAELVVRRLADWAVVVLLSEDDGPGEEAWAHRDPARRADLATYMTGRLRGTGDDAAMVDALLTGEPVQITTIPEERVAPSLPTEEVRAAWRRLDTASCTIVPLRARGETFGALALMNAVGRPPHTEMEIATTVEVARRGALALDNARLYGQQQQVAETLQRSLLTPPPQPDHLEIAVRYRPASAHALVGGDFYDAFPQPDGATLLVVGDVAGHSVEAAAAMSQLRSAVRTLAYDRPDSPAQTLTRVDGVLTGLGFGTLATVLLARIEQPGEQARAGLRTLRWSSAGHLPPLLLHPDGTADLLDSPPERLLGADEPTLRTDHEATLQPGDTLILVTDGVVEHGRVDIDTGLARLTGALTELAGVPIDQLCDRLLDRIVPGRADDDIALLAVRCHPEHDR
ncbi:SpoIIE family protein phosphatase [Geodermatophilus obscurus]|uniref:Putative PAS/PAC sensor protein n=1 Tax=Geodermatophilus obscurus (strain ATCC 25078 / DSM 43160 / JCM 3152 / CCUG 61914 / KCC A-0152 / KCTC 9177 / NBRC 13315 / NRRL B-3577 / G-20) TaxID=526225 RepID=D2SCQ7_GEOOG|nr:SpoIIE family protein phosphatase [Geodermatophilus obscurus]ADB74292.1 putative PAS/PAC sensor protein [Geodermatophilus obscurus DSM 43160]